MKTREKETAEAIFERVSTLPEPTQREVLDFVEYLASKFRREDALWSAFSLREAMRGLEGEEWPNYGQQDFAEKWD